MVNGRNIKQCLHLCASPGCFCQLKLGHPEKSTQKINWDNHFLVDLFLSHLKTVCFSHLKTLKNSAVFDWKWVHFPSPDSPESHRHFWRFQAHWCWKKYVPFVLTKVFNHFLREFFELRSRQHDVIPVRDDASWMDSVSWRLAGAWDEPNRKTQFYENIPSLKRTRFALETGPFQKERNVSQSQPAFFKGNVNFMERKILEDLKLYLDDELDILKWTDGTAQMMFRFRWFQHGS